MKRHIQIIVQKIKARSRTIANNEMRAYLQFSNFQSSSLARDIVHSSQLWKWIWIWISSQHPTWKCLRSTMLSSILSIWFLVISSRRVARLSLFSIVLNMFHYLMTVVIKNTENGTFERLTLNLSLVCVSNESTRTWINKVFGRHKRNFHST